MEAINGIIPRYICNDVGLIDSGKVSFMIYQMGLEGLGALVLLNEKLATSPTHSLHIQYLPVLASKYNTTIAKLETVVRSYGLFQIENDEIFFSDILNKKIEIYATKLKKQIEGGKKSGETRRKQKSLNGGSCEVTSKLLQSNHEQYNKIKDISFKKDIYLLTEISHFTDSFKDFQIGKYILNITHENKIVFVSVALMENPYETYKKFQVQDNDIERLRKFLISFYEKEEIPEARTNTS